MKKMDQAFSDGRKMMGNAQSATHTAMAGGEMMRAASDVIAARLEIMAAGMADPRKTDF